MKITAAGLRKGDVISPLRLQVVTTPEADFDGAVLAILRPVGGLVIQAVRYPPDEQLDVSRPGQD